MKVHRMDLYKNADTDEFILTAKEYRQLKLKNFLFGAASMFSFLWILGWFFDL